jgi:hypothetical protein
VKIEDFEREKHIYTKNQERSKRGKTIEYERENEEIKGKKGKPWKISIG